MLTADKWSLKTGKNDHINGTVKCKRDKLNLLSMNVFEYHIHCVVHIYIF